MALLYVVAGQVLHPVGWGANGDIGWRNADGALFVVGHRQERNFSFCFNIH